MLTASIRMSLAKDPNGEYLRNYALLTVMTLLFMLVGQLLGGERGMLMALLFAAVMNFVSYFFSDKIALAAYRAQPISRDDLPRVYNIVERLAQKVGLPTPKVYLHSTDSPNAFATGRNPARIGRRNAGHSGPAQR